MSGVTSSAFSQGFECFPWRFTKYRFGYHVPAKHAQHLSIVPAFQYPPGVVPPQTNLPLPTVNPSFDVDISLQEVRAVGLNQFPAPTLAPLPSWTGGESNTGVGSRPPKQRSQPIPVFVQGNYVVPGKFASISMKEGISTIEETPETVGDDGDDSDPFGIEVAEDDAPVTNTLVIGETPETVGDDGDDSDPFGDDFS
jgi:hypothetical protein